MLHSLSSNQTFIQYSFQFLLGHDHGLILGLWPSPYWAGPLYYGNFRLFGFGFLVGLTLGSNLEYAIVSTIVQLLSFNAPNWVQDQFCAQIEFVVHIR